jgi:hypothetical protein
LAHFIDPLCGLGGEFAPTIGEFVPAPRTFGKYGACGGVGRRRCAFLAERLIVEAFVHFSHGVHSSITSRTEEVPHNQDRVKTRARVLAAMRIECMHESAEQVA